MAGAKTSESRASMPSLTWPIELYGAAATTMRAPKAACSKAGSAMSTLGTADGGELGLCSSRMVFCNNHVLLAQTTLRPSRMML